MGIEVVTYTKQSPPLGYSDAQDLDKDLHDMRIIEKRAQEYGLTVTRQKGTHSIHIHQPNPYTCPPTHYKQLLLLKEYVKKNTNLQIQDSIQPLHLKGLHITLQTNESIEDNILDNHLRSQPYED